MRFLAITIPGGQQINPPHSIPNGGISYFAKVLGNGLSLFIIAAVFLSLGFLVWGGISWSSSGGDKNKLAAARSKITWAIAGLVISLSVFLILSIIGGIFGVKLLG
jgi:hypothetical protein